jgi:hypothetical protein
LNSQDILLKIMLASKLKDSVKYNII